MFGTQSVMITIPISSCLRTFQLSYVAGSFDEPQASAPIRRTKGHTGEIPYRNSGEANSPSGSQLFSIAVPLPSSCGAPGKSQSHCQRNTGKRLNISGVPSNPLCVIEWNVLRRANDT